MVPGKVRNRYGLAASPVLYGDLLIQVVDLGDDPKDGLSFIVAVRAKDGVEAWRQDRPVQSGWITPLLASLGPPIAAHRDGGPLPEGDTLITVAFPWIIAYDPKTGARRWRVGRADSTDTDEALVKLSVDVATCPIYCGKLVIVPTGESGEAGGHQARRQGRLPGPTSPGPSLTSPCPTSPARSPTANAATTSATPATCSPSIRPTARRSGRL